MDAEIDKIFRESKSSILRGRGYHEYAVIKRNVSEYVRLDDAAILDFGCGDLPVAAASMALRHPGAHVRGTDVSHVDKAKLHAVLARDAGLDVPANLDLQTVAPNTLPDHVRNLDLIYSWSVFEHIPSADVPVNMAMLAERLSSAGAFFFQVGGLYFHDTGSHLKHRFPDEPWHHLVYSLDELRERVFAAPVPEASNHRLWQQFLELNRLTACDFLDAANDAGLAVVWSEQIRKGTPPSRLLRSYTEEALTTTEIRAVFRRK